MTYPPDRLHEEIAFVALHFHWSLDALLDLEHADRRRYVHEINRMNAQMWPGR